MTSYENMLSEQLTTLAETGRKLMRAIDDVQIRPTSFYLRRREAMLMVYRMHATLAVSDIMSVHTHPERMN